MSLDDVEEGDSSEDASQSSTYDRERMHERPSVGESDSDVMTTIDSGEESDESSSSEQESEHSNDEESTVSSSSSSESLGANSLVNSLIAVRSYERLARQRGDLRVCIWRAALNREGVIHRLGSHVLPAVFQSISAVDQILQRDGDIRLDVYFSRAKMETYAVGEGVILNALRVELPSSFIRVHIDFITRLRLREVHGIPQSRGNAARHAGPPPQRRLRICTLNICGIKEKKELLRDFLGRSGVDVCCLQETLRNNSQWSLKIPGFDVVEVLMEESRDGRTMFRGVAIAVRKSRVRAIRVGGVSKSSLFVKVFPKSQATWEENGEAVTTLGREGIIVGSVYIPVRGGGEVTKMMVRNRVFRDTVRLRRTFKESPILITGDWNNTSQQLFTKLASLRANLQGSDRTRIVDVVGSNITRMNWETGRGRDIDHIVEVREATHSGTVRRAWVDRGCDLSDHWPICCELSLAVVEPEQPGNRVAQLETDNDVIRVGKVRRSDGEDEWVVVTRRRHRRRGAPREALGGAVGEIEGRGAQVGANLRAHLRQADLRLREGEASDSLNIDRKKLQSAQERVANHNRWEVLDREVAHEEVDVQTLGRSFTETSSQVATEQQLQRDDEAMGGERRALLGRRTKRLVIKRRRAYRRLVQARSENLSGASNEGELSQRADEYLEEKGRLKGAMRNERKKQFANFVLQGTQKFCQHDYREFWRWLRVVNGKEGSGGKAMYELTMPIRDPDRNERLLTNPHDIAKGWALHYGRLAADTTGHSTHPTYFKDKVARDRYVTEGGSLRRGLLQYQMGILNNELSWEEVADTIKELPNGKATGEDGIPGEWLKACLCHHCREEAQRQARRSLEEPQEVRCVEPCNPMARMLFKTLQEVWIKHEIPEAWRSAVLVSIPKKSDDPLDANNHRGISLIAVPLKLLCRILAKRLATNLEKLDLLQSEQSGFRSREEAVAQAAALWEILGRRRALGEKTYLAFLDLKKAYDTVPHEALFEKLRWMGVDGRLMRFLRELYAQSNITIQSRSTETDYVIEVKRGLRQGCPLSPVLFNVFINDALRQMEWGVDVPVGDWSRRRARNRRGEMRKCGGLAFADDIVLMANTAEELAVGLERMDEWTTDYEMTFGIAKCGVMIIDGDEGDYEQAHHTLAGQELPQVKSYVYLGVKITDTLDRDEMINLRYDVLAKRVKASKAFLLARSIPILAKVMVLKSMVIPSYTYGGEIYGMYQEGSKKAEKLVNVAMKWIVGVKGPGVDGKALRRELNIPPIHVNVSSLRARLFRKAHTMRTWIGKLARQPLTGLPGYWWSRTAQTWLQRYATEYLVCNTEEEVEMISNITGPRISDPQGGGLDRWVGYRYTNAECKLALWQHWEDRSSETLTNTLYRHYDFMVNRKILFDFAMKRPDISTGINLVIRARLRTLWTSRQLAFMDVLPRRMLTTCPFCGREGVWAQGETHTHILVECEHWMDQREEILGGVIPRCAWLVTMRNESEPAELRAMLDGSAGDLVSRWQDQFSVFRHRTAEDLLGGLTGDDLRSIRGLLLGGQLEGLSWRWHRDVDFGETRRWIEAIFADVAKFLCQVMQRRRGRLRRYLDRRNRAAG